MTSFLEKLKKGMGIEEENFGKEENEEKNDVVKEEPEFLAQDLIKKEEKKELKKKKIIAKQREETKEKEESLQGEDSWLETEGQLMVDFYQTEKDLFLVSPIAGIKAENLDIEIEKDILTIKGERKNPSPEGVDFFLRECYWGKFSRQIIIPLEVDPNQIEAAFKDGVLTIKLPKLFKEKKRKIVLK